MVDFISTITFVWTLALSAFSFIFRAYVSPADLLKVAGVLLAIAAVQLMVRCRGKQAKKEV